MIVKGAVLQRVVIGPCQRRQWLHHKRKAAKAVLLQGICRIEVAAQGSLNKAQIGA